MKIYDAIKEAALFPVKLYRKYISPYKPPCCRFTPTCSEYAILAVREWGIVVGTVLSIWRILRCNPFGKGGYDPVPERKRKSAPRKTKGKEKGEQN